MVLWLERMNEIRQPGYYVKTFKTFIKVYSAFCAICTSTSRKNLQNLLQGPLIITFWSIVSCWLISEMSLVLLLLPYCRAIFSWVSKVHPKYNATGLKNLATSSSSQAKSKPVTNLLLRVFNGWMWCRSLLWFLIMITLVLVFMTFGGNVYHHEIRTSNSI